MDTYHASDRQRLLGAYMHAVREQTFAPSSKGNDHLVASSCRTALDSVRKAFRANGRPDPALDADGKLALILHYQLRGYTNMDPSPKQQRPIPLVLIKQMIQRPCADPGLIAFHQLFNFAFFFAMRSCEYLKTDGEKRTHPIRLRNLVFRRRHHIIPHDDPNLAEADTITVTFEFQKRDLRDDAVTQSSSGDPLLCPVRAAAAIVHRMKKFNADENTFIYIYQDTKGRLLEMKSDSAREHLRCFIDTIDKSWGLTRNQVGLHSGRTSAAMAMYLNEIPVYTIMLLGRWSSDAFLRYIRKQVTEFSNNVSRKMIQNPVFHHIEPPSREDPRTHNSMAASANMGMGAGGATINRNVFSVWV